MFTIEHDYDATIVTLVDEGETPLKEDVIIHAFEDCITLTQYDARLKEDRVITLSIEQVRDLGAALDLPEGVYRLARDDDDTSP
jgi:hypothetical protein